MENHCLYGLIGFPLSHSFSQRYFTDKFVQEGLTHCTYKNFPINHIGELNNLLGQHQDLCGFNVTIPYKEQIIPYIDELDNISTEIGAVNTIQILRSGTEIQLKGYNTDVYGFSRSLEEWFTAYDRPLPKQALVLGTGGASKAVALALYRLDVDVHLVSRNTGTNVYKAYGQLNAEDIASHHLIVNTSPLGMYPNISESPNIPYQYLTEQHFLYDLVYNPEETLFMSKGKEMGAVAHNGERMLHLQADEAWEIWQGNVANDNDW